MQALKIQKRIDSEILYLHLPEFRDMIGKNVEIIILPGSEKKSEKKDRLLSKNAYAPESSYREQPATSGTGCENSQLLETINAAYDDMPEETGCFSAKCGILTGD